MKTYQHESNNPPCQQVLTGEPFIPLHLRELAIVPVTEQVRARLC